MREIVPPVRSELVVHQGLAPLCRQFRDTNVTNFTGESGRLRHVSWEGSQGLILEFTPSCCSSQFHSSSIHVNWSLISNSNWFTWIWCVSYKPFIKLKCSAWFTSPHIKVIRSHIVYPHLSSTAHLTSIKWKLCCILVYSCILFKSTPITPIYKHKHLYTYTWLIFRISNFIFQGKSYELILLLL